MEYLEKIEKRRKVKRLIIIGIKVVCLLVICFFTYKLYLYILPYKESLDKFNEFREELNIKDNYLDGALDSFKNLFNE